MSNESAMHLIDRRRGTSRIAFDFDERKVDAVFAELNQCHLPGAALGIAVGGRPIYRKGFGLANMELPVLLSPWIRMRVYSVTKQFTCFTYMMLCEQGKAGIDDPVGKYFPEFRPVTQKVTMRQLMGNVSGLRDAHGLSFQFCGTQWVAPSSEVIQLYRTADDVDAAPGTTWFYNNGGFALLSEAIERISGQTLGECMRQLVFEPIGMHDTLLRRHDTDFVPNSASMHMTSRQDGGFVKNNLGGDRSGTGGIASTVNDMLRWMAHMDAPTVGTPETWRLMKTPLRLANGSPTGYGFGLMRESYRGIETIHHPGGGMGANAQILKVPAANLDIAVMVNREDVSSRELCLKVLDACLSGLDPVQDAVRMPLLNGTFRSPKSGLVIHFSTQGERQLVSIGGGSDVAFVSDEAGVLWPARTSILSSHYSITLLGKRDHPGSLRFVDHGHVDELVRVTPARDADISSIAGVYRSESTGFEMTITSSGMHARGRFGSLEYSLDALGDGLWRAKVVTRSAPALTGLLCFDAEGFRFWSYCTRALPFRRLA